MLKWIFGRKSSRKAAEAPGSRPTPLEPPEGSLDLTTRFGAGGSDPTLEDLENALDELFNEGSIPNVTEGDLAEHPNTWLEWGYQNGEKWTTFCLDAYRKGTLTFTKLNDQDDREPEFEYSLRNVPRETVLKLWKLLASGDTDAILDNPWSR